MITDGGSEMSENRGLMTSSQIQEFVQRIGNPSDMTPDQASRTLDQLVLLLQQLLETQKVLIETQKVLSAVRKLLNDSETQWQWTPAIRTRTLQVLDDKTLSDQDKIRTIGTLMDGALRNPTTINLLLFKVHPTHPDTTKLCKEVYKICTGKEWSFEVAHDDQPNAAPITPYHKRNSSGSSALP